MMPTLTEAVGERMVGGMRWLGSDKTGKPEGYLKQLVVWIRILFLTVLMISLVTIVL